MLLENKCITTVTVRPFNLFRIRPLNDWRITMIPCPAPRARCKLSDATASMSVYQYANNNPVMMNDPNGNYALPLSNIVYYQGQMTFGPGISRRDFKRAFAAMWGIWDNNTFFGEGDYAHGGIVEELMSVGGGAGTSSGGASSGGGLVEAREPQLLPMVKLSFIKPPRFSIFCIQTL